MSQALQLSQDLLYTVKMGKFTDDLLQQICDYDKKQLLDEFKSDSIRIAFWLNIYNANTQIFLKKNPELYKNRQLFFTKKQICVAGNQLSLNEIEHGILRKLRTAHWLLDLFGSILASAFVRKCQVSRVDPRIHFALNCGAQSCPPIRFYESEKLDFQLNMATNSYLLQESQYSTETNIVKIPALFKWFQKDFGGRKGVVEFLRKYDVVPAESAPKIYYKNYSWKLSTGNYETNVDE